MIRSVVFLSLILFTFSFAQPEEEMLKSSPQRFSPISFETIPYWCEDTASINLVVLYRIHPEFFFFAKTNKTPQGLFEAHGELLFEIFDDKDNALTRQIRPLLIERNSLPEESVPFTKEITGIIVFRLNKGFYKIVVEAKDHESGNSIINRDSKIDARSISPRLSLSPSIFIDPVSPDTSSSRRICYVPINRGGKVLLGQPGGCLFQALTLDTATEVHISWTINGRGDLEEDSSQAYHGDRYNQSFGFPVALDSPEHPAISIQSRTGHSRMVFVPLPLERLESGRYKMNLSVTQGPVKSTKEVLFEVLWPQKPHSLSDLRLAIDALQHIASDAERDSMASLSSSKSLAAFKTFWRKRSPDTTRAFNPAMAEYYRRVDECIKRFSSSGETDGYRTDRGRIFILFGTPTITNRLLKPNSAPTEIWTYESIKRRFTFTDQRKTGNYILSKMENY